MRKYDWNDTTELMRVYGSLVYAQIAVDSINAKTNPTTRAAILRSTLEDVIPRYRRVVTLRIRQRLEIKEQELKEKCLELLSQTP